MSATTLTALDGDSMSADDAAWAMVADAAERALTLPGLSREGSGRMLRLLDSSLRAAGLLTTIDPKGA